MIYNTDIFSSMVDIRNKTKAAFNATVKCKTDNDGNVIYEAFAQGKYVRN